MKPLYKHSLGYAKRNGEVEIWRESQTENSSCAAFLDKQVADKFDGSHLPIECIENTINEFGFDRTMWVIANTINERSHDGRISRENRTWASNINVPKDEQNFSFALKSHSCLVDGLTNQVQRKYAELGLFDSTHIVHDDAPQDYKGRLLILRAGVLKEECRTPENQLFYAVSGFGCDPTASGRKVFGQFLSDGEHTHFYRSDFVGIIADEHIPEWAKEKMEQINAPKEEQENNINLNM